MSERGWARLTIGGRAPRHELFKLLAMHADAVPKELKAGKDSGLVYWEHLGEGGGPCLIVEDEEARYAKFDELEIALIKLGVAFDRESAAVGEYPEMHQSFRPGMPSEDCIVAGGEIQVSASDVLARLDKGGETLLRNWLRRVAPEYPPLEPLDLK